jgi:hypothetical protein
MKKGNPSSELAPPYQKMGTRNKHHNMRENGQGVIGESRLSK